MAIAPISLPSLSIGTPTNERAPASLTMAEVAYRSSAARSATWIICFVSTRRPRTAEMGTIGSRRRKSSLRAWGAMESNHPQLTVLEQHQIAELGLAERDCLLQHGIEYRLQLARRARDHAEDLGGCRLSLQCLGKLVRACLHLVEQPHVLDGDNRLVGEGFGQLDLLVGERPYLGVGQRKNSNNDAPA